MHFMNPVPVMQLVEVIRGLATSDHTHQITVELAKKLGKIPAEAGDFPGFIANRILLPMINEAIFCLYQGDRHPRSHRHGDEARHESPDGAADLGRPHRA